MALTPTDYSDNAFGPTAFASDYQPDQLIAGNLKVVSDSVTITGAAALTRGQVMGRVDAGAGVVAAKAGGNTGNGTCVIDATTPILAGAQEGIYTLTCTVAGANSATFRLTDPKGNVLGDFAFSGSGASVTVNDQIKAAVTDGATDFVVGDGFTVTVNLSAGKWKAAVKTSTDGSQFPRAILADNADPSSGDVTGGIYLMGEFNSDKLIYDASYTAEDIKVALRQANCFVKTFVSAADPT